MMPFEAESYRDDELVAEFDHLFAGPDVLAELRESLDEGYRQAITEARKGPPPATGRAYAAVYGCFPRGWPSAP
jgi:hypothetical protein